MPWLRNKLTGNVFFKKTPKNYFGISNRDSTGEPIYEILKKKPSKTKKNPIALPHVEFAIWGYAHGKTMFWNGRTFSPFKKTVERFASKIAAERKLYWLDENRRDKVPAGITTMGVMPL